MAGFGRLALGIALIAIVAVVAFTGIGRSERSVRSRLLDERVSATRAAAASLNLWLEDGRADARALAVLATSGLNPRSAVTAFMAGPHRFASDALVVDTGGRIDDAVPNACADGNFLDLLRPVSDVSGVLLGRIFDRPPRCTAAVIGVAAPAGGRFAVVLARPDDVARQLQAAGELGRKADQKPVTQAFLVDPNGRVMGSALPALGGRVPASAGYQNTGPPGAPVVSSYAPVAGGWGLVIEQDKASFFGNVDSRKNPANQAALIAAACIALGIVVVGIFDARRRRALARADVDRASFLAIVGHELRTPITVLKGFIDTLSARWDQLQEPQRQSLVERLSPQVRRLQRAVDRLLVAADIQRGANARPSSEPVDLQTSLEEVAENHRPLAPLHTFDVHVEGDPVARADRKALAQVLDQLVDNAVKYSPSGGRVLLQGRRTKGRVEVVVEDEGVGLPSDFDRIFEAFTQGEDVDRRTHDEGGVGVGLFIARTLVESMGGTIRAERRAPDDGTRIVVTLRGGASTEGAPLAPSARVHGHS